MKKTAIAACALLAGCQSMSYGLQTYGSLKPVPFDSQTTGDSYRIKDIPDEQKLLITPSLGDAFKVGAARGATFGISNPESQAVFFQRAAMEYVASTGRQCMSTGMTKIVDMQYEITYRCDQSLSVTPPA